METVTDVWLTELALPIITRAAERLLVVVGGLMGIYFGYRLFTNGVIVDQSASGEFRTFKLSLGRVGPGVFFALFGTTLLGYSLTNPITVNPDSNSLTFAHQGTNEEPLALVKTLNALQGLRADPNFKLPKFYPTASFDKAIDILETRRDRYIIYLFGTDRYGRYLTKRDVYMRSPQSFDAQERDKLREIHSVYESRFEQ